MEPLQTRDLNKQLLKEVIDVNRLICRLKEKASSLTDLAKTLSMINQIQITCIYLQLKWRSDQGQ